jgi:hypothetical protein
LQQRHRDCALAGTDLEQLFVAGRVDGRNDPADDHRVVQEVLAEPFPWTVTQGVILVLGIVNSRL